MNIITGRGQVVKGDVFIFPKGQELNSDDLTGFMNYQDTLYRKHYKRNYDYYTSKHDILKRKLGQWTDENRLVAPMPRLLVDEYSGYFGGNAPKFQLDNDTDNQMLSDWINYANLDDEHSEVVKSVAIYGRGYLLAYQDENAVPQVAHVEADEGFMIYDDTIKAEPLAFVRYFYTNDNERKGTIYYAGKQIDFIDNKLGEETPNVFKEVPCVELYANEERQGIFDGVITLIDGLDRALSRKSDQVDYFADAYMKVLGIDLEDENGKIAIDKQNKLIYSKDPESANAVVDFIAKPDGDTVQENLINRLIDLIYYTSMIPNLQDSAFSGNSSGVALQYKLLPMQNMASFQERKFKKAMRNLFRLLFESADGGQIVRDSNSDSWKTMKITYTRNMPQNIQESVQTAVQASQILSQETALSIIPIVDDPKSEIKLKQEEQAEQTKQALQNAPSIDYLKQDKAVGDNGEEDTEEQAE